MKMKKQASLWTTFVIVITFVMMVGGPLLSHATEIDSFTLRFPPMRDATERVDQLTKELLLKGIELANKSGNCDEASLYSNVRETMGAGLLWSNLESLLSTDYLIDRRTVSREDSIFAEISPLSSIPLFLVSLGGTFQIGEHVIGTDKFGHFFQDGGSEFDLAYVQGLGIEEALKFGEAKERGLEGLQITGVYSYADLVSNFKGMMFYRKLTKHYLEDGESPYVVCQDNLWVLSTFPSWIDIVDGGMDEAINCNSYSNPDFEGKVKAGIAKLEVKFQRPFQCPINPDLCRKVKADLERDFPKYFDRLISPECLNLK